MTLGARRSYRLLFWFFIIIGGNLIFSCQSEDCVSTFNNEMLVGFFETDTLESGEIEITEKDTLFYSVVADGNDSVFYDLDTLVSTLTLPVNPAADMTAYKLYVLDSISRDTVSYDPLQINVTYHPNPIPHVIKVSYRRFTRVITADCGAEIGYVDLHVDETTFPVYQVDSDQLSRFNETNERVNIEIYF